MVVNPCRRLWWLYLFFVSLFLTDTVGATPLEKRATEVSLNSYTFSNNVLAGSIHVRLFEFPSHISIADQNYKTIRSRTSPTQRLSASTGPLAVHGSHPQ